MVAIRIEHQTSKVGLFHHSFTYDSDNYHKHNDVIFRFHQKPDLMTPQEEFLDLKRYGKKWFCAFKSLHEMRTWITKKDIKDLSKIGFSVLALTLDNTCQIGEHQLIFTKESVIKQDDITKILTTETWRSIRKNYASLYDA